VKGKYLIIGRQGSGKTTLWKLLKEKGFTAYDVDHDGLADFKNLATGKLESFDEVEKTKDGLIDYKKYTYEMSIPKLKRVLTTDDLVFVCGGARYNIEEYYPLFDKVFVLIIDRDTARERMLQHEFETHHNEEYIEFKLKDFEKLQQDLIDAGNNTEIIDATRSADEILTGILEKVKNESPTLATS